MSSFIDTITYDAVLGPTNIKFIPSGYVISSPYMFGYFECIKFSDINCIRLHKQNIHDQSNLQILTIGFKSLTNDGNNETRGMSYNCDNMYDKPAAVSAYNNALPIAESIMKHWYAYLLSHGNSAELQQRVMKLEKEVVELRLMLQYAPPPHGGSEFVEARSRFENNSQ